MFDLSELPRPVIRYGAGLWRRRWLIAAFAWLTALVGWAAIWLIPDTYESQAHVNIQEPLLDPLLKNDAVRPDYAQRVEVLRLSLLTFPNVEEMVYRVGLDKTVEATTPLDRQAQLERLVKDIAGSIRIESPRDMYFVIKAVHSDPAVARDVVDAALNILIEQDLGASLRDQEASERRLKSTIAQYDALLSEQEREIAEYRRVHAEELASTLGDEQSKVRREARLTDIVDNKSQVRLRVETLRARLAVTPRVSTGGELEDLKIQLSQLRSQYNDNYPDIQNLLSQIARLESDDALPDNPDYQRIASELQSARDTLRALQVRENRIRAQIETEAVTLGQAPAVVAQLQRLARNNQETKEIYQRLTASRDSLALRKTLDSGGRGLEYRVFEPPRKALVPSDPPRMLLILGATVLAFGVAGFVALVMTFLEKTYTQLSDLEEAFGLPVLGAVGQVQTMGERRRVRFDFLRLFAVCSALFLLCFGYIYAAVLHPQAAVLKRGDSAVAGASLEPAQSAIRGLR
ncbi:MAG: hypothetical protein AAFR20_03910 [Pseudomonadota bacterium]